MRKLTSLLAAIALAATSLAPAAAEARDRHGRNHHRHDHYYRGHDNGDAVAAGVVGLVLGLAIGSMASEPREADCYDNYRRCDPPPPQRGSYDPRYDDRGYDDEDLEGGYDPRYEDPRAAYERDYRRAPDRYAEPECTRRERQWDRYANRYLMVDVPC